MNTQTGKRQNRSGMKPAHVACIVGMLWQLSPARLVALMVTTVAISVVPAIQLQLTAAAVQTVADAVTQGDADRNTRAALALGALIMVVSMIGHLMGAAHQYLDSILRLYLSTAIGERLMLKSTRLELQDYEDAESYDMIQRAYQESNGARVHQLLTDTLEFVRELITMVSVAAVLLSWNPWVALLVLVSPIPSAVSQMFYGKRVYEIEYARTADRRRLLYYQYLTTTDHSFKEVRLFGLADHLIEWYRTLVREFLRVDRSVTRRQSVMLGALGLVSVVISSGAVVYAMTTTVRTGEVGQLAGYLQAIGVVQASAYTMMLGIAMLFQNALFVGNLFALFDLPERRVRGGSRPFPDSLTTGIEFRDVSFTYPGTTEPVLDGVSFTLAAGECTALVGQNGAGKTTLVKLLTRLYEPTGGQILLNGVPIEEYDLDGLRRNRRRSSSSTSPQRPSTPRPRRGCSTCRRLAICPTPTTPTPTKVLRDHLDPRPARPCRRGRQVTAGHWRR
ncbi:MAG: ATP-binding cassette, subfamily bacterial [Actinomycetota bacterium]|nr:ATP-binding cassette, subfamily bacterial [Actinomycetota bacterium]